MSHESIDKEMSQWLVSCEHKGTRFFLTPEHTATDILERAARFRDRDLALYAAVTEREAPAWAGRFSWTPVTRPSVH